MTLSRKPDDVLQRIGAGGLNETVARIVATFDRATASDIEAGARWYGEDSTVLLRGLAATGHTSVEHAAAVVAHLSPRTTWSRNIAGAYALMTGGAYAALELGCMGPNIERALRALESEAPLETFGPNAYKTTRFAQNLLGNRDFVTIDVWAARVAMGDDVFDQELALKRVGVYVALELAYKRAARLRGVDATTMQATTWIVARNGRSN